MGRLLAPFSRDGAPQMENLDRLLKDEIMGVFCLSAALKIDNISM